MIAPAMRVHGIDLGMRSFHVFSECGARTVEVPKSNRYEEIGGLAHHLKHMFEPEDVIFYEEPILAGPRNIRTLIGMSQTSGILLGASSARCYEVPVATWKKEVVGSGKASKDDVARWLSKKHPDIYSKCLNQNHIDAACIYLYGQLVVDRLSSVM